MLDDHIGENAELYALGQLGELESSRVERHARTCDACARRLGDAEAAVLHLIESGDLAAPPAELDRRVRFAGRPPIGWIAAVAAAFVLGLLPWSVATFRHAHGGTANQQLAMNAMLAGHFLHAPAASLVPGAPQAKVIYPREGGWLYVLVGPAGQPVDVVAVIGSEHRTVASIPPGTQTRSAFVPIAAQVSTVQLLEDGTPVASARIVYASPEPSGGSR